MRKLKLVTRNQNRVDGFTLIELLVIVSVFGIILVSLSTILINIVKARNRTYIIQDLENNGNLILERIKYNLINANQMSIVCPGGSGVGSSMAFVDKLGFADLTVLRCMNNDRIASASATIPENEFVYTNNSVNVSGCGSFVTCHTDPLTNSVTSVDFNFTLSAGDTNNIQDLGAAINRSFNTSVVVRK